MYMKSGAGGYQRKPGLSRAKAKEFLDAAPKGADMSDKSKRNKRKSNSKNGGKTDECKK